MAVKIIKITDTSFTVNGKTVYEDMNGNIAGRVNLSSEECDAFNKYYTTIKNTSKNIEVKNTQLKVVWLVHFGHQTKPKNKLQTAIQNYLQSLDRKVILNKDLGKLQRQIIFAIQKFNESYKNCSPINTHWFAINNDKLLSGVGVVQFTLKRGVIEV